MTKTTVQLNFEEYLAYDDYRLTEFSGEQQIISPILPLLSISVQQIVLV